jgi:hypothetical protein
MNNFFFYSFETEYLLLQADLELVILLSQLPKSWDYRHATPHPALWSNFYSLYPEEILTTLVPFTLTSNTKLTFSLFSTKDINTHYTT